MGRRRPYRLLVALSMALLFVLSGCGNTFHSNGERIYRTATSASGQPIIPERFFMPMMRAVCANCHGPQGHGGNIFIMMYRYEVPNITWPVLTGPFEDHQPYTEETVKQAITQGIDPAGNPLEYPMPRWQISPQDLNDLLSFIKTLK